MQTNCLQLKSICSFLTSLKTAASSYSLLFPPAWMIWHSMIPAVAMLLKLLSTACVFPSAEPLVLTLCCSLHEANRHFRILCLHGELGLETDLVVTECMFAWQSISSTRLNPWSGSWWCGSKGSHWSHPEAGCAREKLTAEGKDRMTTRPSTTVKAKQVEPQLELLVINNTSATSNPFFDPFHSPQGDHDLHFEKHCCITTKLRGEVYWQYSVVNPGWITYTGLTAAWCSWCTEVNLTH